MKPPVNPLLNNLINLLTKVEHLPTTVTVLASGETVGEIRSILARVRRLSKRITRYEQILDANYEEIALGVLAPIDSKGAAIEAVSLYDTSYLANLALSEQAQVKLTRALIEKCATFKVNSPAWDIISRNNAVDIEDDNNEIE